MKITRYAMMLLAAAGAMQGCSELDQTTAYAPTKIVAPVLNALPSEIVITAENLGETQVFTWDAADFGVLTQINYSIEAEYNAVRLPVVSGQSGTSATLSYQTINSTLALAIDAGGLGVPSETPSDVQFYVSATIGSDFEIYYSEPVTVKMTVTTAERKYPTIWVIGDYC